MRRASWVSTSKAIAAITLAIGFRHPARVLHGRHDRRRWRFAEAT
jgi:hypothetical protein